MTAKLLLNYVCSLEVVLFVIALVLVFRSGAYRRMGFFAGFLGLTALQGAVDLAVMYHRKELGISALTACTIFRYTGWTAEIGQAVLLLLTIYGVFRQLMEPLQGLHRVGGLVFRWTGAVAICLAGVVVFGPHQIGTTQFETLCTQFQEGVTILTLCMLLAVSLATRPLGLSVASRVFGTLLGLGVLSLTSLVASTWFGSGTTQSPYSPVHLIGAFGALAAASIWTVYFARPEPARRMITLPTTSPFFFWNRIAEALGDAPGEVVVGGFSPTMFAPAELLAFSGTPRQPAPVVEMPKIAQR